MIRAVQEGPGFSPGLPQLFVLNCGKAILSLAYDRFSNKMNVRRFKSGVGFAIIMFNLIFVNLVIAGLHSYA